MLWTICALVSLLFLVSLVKTKSYWTRPAGTPPKISTDRAEKSCDAVLSVCALLIPATLGLVTWLHEKVGAGNYMIPLGFALLYFFGLLIFTAYLRFNFLWGFERDFDQFLYLRFGYWLTTATSGIVLGLILLSIPVVQLGFGRLKVKEATPNVSPVKVECNCRSADADAAPVPTPPKPPACIHNNKPGPCASK